jgi:alpha-tubulin suppressor-like RCC1 family protein
LALLADGTIAAWGRNDYGQTDVPSCLTNVVAISAGKRHNLALRADGTVAAWGLDSSGQVTVPDGLTNVVAIAAGLQHSLALKTDGSVTGWGSASLFTLPSGLSNVVAISAGELHNLALKRDGTVVAWGLGSMAVLPKDLGDVVAVSASEFHSLALRSDGTVAAWGRNLYGLTNVPVGLRDVVAISAGSRHSLALRSDGTVVAWGKADGQLIDIPAGLGNVVMAKAGGIATYGGHSVALVRSGLQITVHPFGKSLRAGDVCRLQVMVVGTPPLRYQWQFQGQDIPNATNSFFLKEDVQIADAGAYKAVVSNAEGMVTSTIAEVSVASGTVVAWGNSDYGSYTTGETNVPPGLMNVVAVAAGRSHSVALKDDGTVVAWGTKNYIRIPTETVDCIAVAAGFRHTVALGSDGTLLGWGEQYQNELTFGASATNLIAVAAGNYLTLALTMEGNVLAWGAAVPPGLSNVVAIDAYSRGCAALDASGKVKIWGDLWYPLPPPYDLTNAIAISLGMEHALALRPDGSVIGWSGGSDSRLLPPPGLSNIVAIAAGSLHSLALQEDGTVYSWGKWGYPIVTTVPDGLKYVTSIAVGPHHSLATMGTGEPVITISPFSQTANASAPVKLYAKAVGIQPLQFQWQFDGINIPDATNDSLTLPAVPGRAGVYRVVVSNARGSTTSRPAVLKIAPPRFDLSAEVSRMTPWGFKSRIVGVGPERSVVYASTNLVEWSPICTNSPVGDSIPFLDSAATNLTQRFYRILVGEPSQ